jgi:hypothetical protein
VDDNGAPDGIPTTVGRAAIRDWIEQKIPHLLDYPISDFRVHTVIKSNPSRIPADKEVIVIDVGDSAAAPHQNKRDKIYYRREGGRSVAAPHFYLEILRQRLTNPVLEFKLKKIEDADVYEHDDGLLLRVQLKFEIEDVGRVAAYDWQLSVRTITNEKINLAERVDDYHFGTVPSKKGEGVRPISIPLSRTILPGCKFIESQPFGCRLRPKAHTEEAVREEIEAMLAATTLHYQLATETAPGEFMPISFTPLLDTAALATAAKQKCLEFFHN